MRPNQNNKRSRGRGRKPQGNNPNRSLDSNGPDVKIRGTAAHIYDKYQSLSRDANVAGDYVAAENYQQHAEHYFRLMAAAQAQNQNQASGGRENSRMNGNRRNGRAPAEAEAAPADGNASASEGGGTGAPESAPAEKPETDSADAAAETVSAD